MRTSNRKITNKVKPLKENSIGEGWGNQYKDITKKLNVRSTRKSQIDDDQNQKYI